MGNDGSTSPISKPDTYKNFTVKYNNHIGSIIVLSVNQREDKKNQR